MFDSLVLFAKNHVQIASLRHRAIRVVP